ncbi:MAG: roadblock/LC7 domain-containing protein [Longimicrobiaceae bacterium]
MNGYGTLLEAVNRVPGVRGAMVAAAGDGLVVEEDLMVGVPGPPVAALAASLFQRARRSLAAAELGSISFLQVEAEHGYLFVAAPGRGSDLLLITVAERWTNVGMVRLEMLRGAGALA